MRFEWDEAKAEANLKKHGVSFDEACSLFKDPLYLVFADPDHSETESRSIIVGESTKQRLLVVSFVERQNSTRIISARDATRSEREFYEKDN